MLLRRLLLVVLPLLLLAACAAPEPTTMPPPPPPTAEPPPAPEPEPTPESEPAPEPEDDPLYQLTEDNLRQAFTDGMFGLYRAEANPSAARRLDRAGIEAWLTDLALVSPRAVEFARRTLGPVLEEAYVVGFVLEDAAAAECASIRDVLYIHVPERFQEAERPFTGFIVQDACDVASGELARFCTGGFGTTDDGTTCSCTCTTGEAPGLGCVSC